MSSLSKLILSSFQKINFEILGLSLLLFWSCSPTQPKENVSLISPTKETIIENLKRPWSMDFISEKEVIAVSYTHLTLPTNREV